MAVPRRLLAIAGFATAVGASAAFAQQEPVLGSAASFAVLGGSAVTNSGRTVVSGNVGVAPGTTIAGFPDGVIRLGTKASDDALAREAQHAAAALYGDLAARNCRPLPSVTDLPPDVYCVSSPFFGVITLNPGTAADPFWIFKVSGSLSVAPGTTIDVINGGHNGKVYWQVPGAVLLGADSAFVGNILTPGAITLAHGASLLGRALSLNGTVTLDTNTVSLCCEPITLSALSNGTAGTPYSSAVTASGGMAPYTFKVIEGTAPTGNRCGHFEFTVMATDMLGCYGVRKYAVDIGTTIDIGPADLPPATACLPYNETIIPNGGVGTYRFSGTPPLDLHLNPATGVLFGTPATAGTYQFPVTATDSAGCTATRIYTLLVKPNTLTIAPSNPILPDGFVGVPYQQTFTPAGCPGPFTCTVTDSTLPTDPTELTLTNCVLSGIPLREATYTFTVNASDPSGSAGKQSYKLAIHCAPITISPATLPNGVVGIGYSAQLQGSSLVGPPYTFALAPGSVLPPGFTPPLTAGGIISGTPPTTAGLFEFFVVATDRFGCSSTQKITITILPAPVCQSLALSPSTVPNGIVGSTYPLTGITAMGGVAPYTFSILSGALPPGLMLSMAGFLYSTPTPTTTGSYCVTILATDSGGCRGTITYTIIINPAPCPTISLSPSTLPPATVSVPYTLTLTPSGGTPPYMFSVFSGALPFNLSLSSTGTISGTPTGPGGSSVTIIATDANGCIGSIGCVFLPVDVPALSGAALWMLAVALATIALAIARGPQ